jgi:hypothetical protein
MPVEAPASYTEATGDGCDPDLVGALLDQQLEGRTNPIVLRERSFGFTRSPQFNSCTSQWVGVGAQWLWKEHRTVGLDFSYANLGPARINSSTLRGEYDRNNLFSVAVYLSWGKLPWSEKLTF